MRVATRAVAVPQGAAKYSATILQSPSLQYLPTPSLQNATITAYNIVTRCGRCASPDAFGHMTTKEKNKQIEHHATPRRASATAPLRVGADMGTTGPGAGNHDRTEDQACRRKRANIDAFGG